jgi:hypothetical protein
MLGERRCVMKVIGFKSRKTIIVEMGVKELLNLSGFESYQSFNKEIGEGKSLLRYSDELEGGNEKSLMSIENIPVCDMFSEVKSILETYSNLESKLISIRNQITTLTKAMKAYNEMKGDGDPS